LLLTAATPLFVAAAKRRKTLLRAARSPDIMKVDVLSEGTLPIAHRL
jgi:hypothetical protein